MELVFKGEYAQALRIQDRMTPLHAADVPRAGRLRRQIRVSLLGRARNEVRLPLVPIGEATEAAIRRAMVHARRADA